jgi:long-chain acyl-CoA synthetase
MALQKAIAERWESLPGCRISEGYGMTESSPVLTVNILGKEARLGYIGLPVPSTDVKIVDENGLEVPMGNPGEIIAKGPQIMKGYYRKPEETAKTVKNGWLYTGDIGVMEAEGYFKIVDRKKDMILVSGFNVYPNEIEDVLVTHPKILEAAAIGIPDDKSGEVVKVFIVKRDESLTEEEVKEFSRENFTGYKCPKYVEFRKELPKTNVGKVLRKDLRG